MKKKKDGLWLCYIPPQKRFPDDNFTIPDDIRGISWRSVDNAFDVNQFKSVTVSGTLDADANTENGWTSPSMYVILGSSRIKEVRFPTKELFLRLIGLKVFVLWCGHTNAHIRIGDATYSFTGDNMRKLYPEEFEAFENPTIDYIEIAAYYKKKKKEWLKKYK